MNQKKKRNFAKNERLRDFHSLLDPSVYTEFSIDANFLFASEHKIRQIDVWCHTP